MSPTGVNDDVAGSANGKVMKPTPARTMPTKAWGESSNIFSRACMLWFWPLLNRGSKHLLTAEDLGPVSHLDEPAALHARFERLWQQELERVKHKNESNPHQRPEHQPSLVRVVLQHIGWRTLLFCFGLAFLAAALGMCLPFFAKMLVETLSGLGTLDDTGIVLVAVALTVLPMLASICQGNLVRISSRASMHIYTALSMAIFNKSLKLSGAARNKASSGNIVNLMSTDAGSSMERMVFQFFPVVIAPFQLVILIYFLFMEIGPAMVSPESSVSHPRTPPALAPAPVPAFHR
jgi:ATP-binding cassette subfamily C (CFTR/MRP) protein 1